MSMYIHTFYILLKGTPGGPWSAQREKGEDSKYNGDENIHTKSDPLFILQDLQDSTYFAFFPLLFYEDTSKNRVWAEVAQ